MHLILVPILSAFFTLYYRIGSKAYCCLRAGWRLVGDCPVGDSSKRTGQGFFSAHIGDSFPFSCLPRTTKITNKTNSDRSAYVAGLRYASRARILLTQACLPHSPFSTWGILSFSMWQRSVPVGGSAARRPKIFPFAEDFSTGVSGRRRWGGGPRKIATKFSHPLHRLSKLEYLHSKKSASPEKGGVFYFRKTRRELYVGVSIDQADAILRVTRVVVDLLRDMRSRAQNRPYLGGAFSLTRDVALFSLAFASMRRGHDLSFTLGSQVLRLPDAS